MNCIVTKRLELFQEIIDNTILIIEMIQYPVLRRNMIVKLVMAERRKFYEIEK